MFDSDKPPEYQLRVTTRRVTAVSSSPNHWIDNEPHRLHPIQLVISSLTLSHSRLAYPSANVFLRESLAESNGPRTEQVVPIGELVFGETVG